MALVRAVQDHDAEEARRLNARLEPLWVLFREFSSLRVIYAICSASVAPRRRVPSCRCPAAGGGRAQDIGPALRPAPLEVRPFSSAVQGSAGGRR
jgi:4-hydroxy-tetrahydrodipicolinate synthase